MKLDSDINPGLEPGHLALRMGYRPKINSEYMLPPAIVLVVSKSAPDPNAPGWLAYEVLENGYVMRYTDAIIRNFEEKVCKNPAAVLDYIYNQPTKESE